MERIIHISRPYIKDCKSNIFINSIRLSADITMVNPNTGKEETKECYFEFEKKYEKYLCPERSDAFVVGLLITAMENNMNIEFEAPISESLYYQMMTYYIPMVSKYNKNYPMHNIKLIGRVDSSIILNEDAVATGCSGGVDSFYTMIKHNRENTTKEHQITHLVYSSSGAELFEEEKIKENYLKNLPYVKKISEECKLGFIACYNNLYEFYKIPLKSFITFFTTTFGTIAYALQKLISVYYASSGDPIEEFNLDLSKVKGYDASVFDLFTVSCMNTENLSFYSTGAECSRNEKIEYIVDDKVVQNNLLVCGVEINGYGAKYVKNCSHCKKCVRTMFSLYSIGKLDKFNKVFNIEMFKNKIGKNLGKLMVEDKKDYTNASIKNCQRNEIKIPISAYLYKYLIYKPLYFFRKKLKNSLLARKIYYKLNLDYKIDGYRGSNYDYYQSKLEKKDEKDNSKV